MIGKLNGIDPIASYSSAQKISRNQNSVLKDSILVSDEARLKSDYLKVEQEVKSSANIREDRIREVMEKLEDPNYINNKILGEVADKIMYLFQ